MRSTVSFVSAARQGIARAIHVTTIGRRVLILRALVKKTQKTPSREIDLANERARRLE